MLIQKEQLQPDFNPNTSTRAPVPPLSSVRSVESGASTGISYNKNIGLSPCQVLPRSYAFNWWKKTICCLIMPFLQERDQYLDHPMPLLFQ